MKKFFLTILSAIFLCLISTSCSDSSVKEDTSKLKVATGLPPIAFLVDQIGKDKVECVAILPVGRTPHDYAPTPQDIRNMASSKIFFTTEMIFEEQLEKTLDKGNIDIVNIKDNVKYIPFTEEDHEHEHAHAKEHAHEHEHEHEAMDPHIWLSIENNMVMADNIAKELCKIDPENAKYYQANLLELKEKLAKLLVDIRQELKPYAGKKFYVYHPAFGYFANDTNLKQVGVELGGREMNAQHLAKVIKEAKNDGVKTVFTQGQYNVRGANALANAINGTVGSLDPLEYDVIKNIQYMTKMIKNGFCKEKEEK